MALEVAMARQVRRLTGPDQGLMEFEVKGTRSSGCLCALGARHAFLRRGAAEAGDRRHPMRQKAGHMPPRARDGTQADGPSRRSQGRFSIHQTPSRDRRQDQDSLPCGGTVLRPTCWTGQPRQIWRFSPWPPQASFPARSRQKGLLELDPTPR